MKIIEYYHVKDTRTGKYLFPSIDEKQIRFGGKYKYEFTDIPGYACSGESFREIKEDFKGEGQFLVKEFAFTGEVK